MRADDDPKRLDRRYINETGRGCRTCGWWIWNDAPDADKQWTEHDHDPLDDIEEKVLAGVKQFTADDVVFLLALIRPSQWSREAAAADGDRWTAVVAVPSYIIHRPCEPRETR